MHIIRHHSHTQKSAKIYGWGALVLLAAVLILSFVNRTLASIPLLLFCIFGFQFLKEVLIPGAERWITGHMGERRVLTVLRDLPDTYVAVTNFVVPGSERGDIDLILIGPMGFLAMEIKTYEGMILFENGRWWKRQKNGWKTRLKKNPSVQAKGHRKALIGYWKAYIGFLPQDRDQYAVLSKLYMPIVPVLVFVGADGLETGSLDMAAVRVGDLLDYVRSLPPRLTENQVENVAGIFATDKPVSARQGAGYNVRHP